MAEVNSAADMVAYRNKNTQTIHLYDAESADLEARPNFERVALSEVPAATLDEALRERANRASIARAGERRSADKGVEITVDENAGGPGGVTAATPTTRRIGAGAPDGVLSRPGVDDVQIGPNPEQHPKTLAELEAQAALDAEVPQNVGVLVKQHTEGDPVSEQVPAEAANTADRLAPGTEVSEVKVDEDATAKQATPRKRTASKATAAKSTTEGDTTK